MSKTFCTYPWNHLFVQPSGHQKICCLSNQNITKDDNYHQFNLANDDLFSSWNSDYMKNTRKRMLAGEKSETCQRCYQAEERGLESMRDSREEDYWRSLTAVDGALSSDPSHVELHFGNVCNLNCKMCSQMFSTSIGKELLNMGKEDPEFIAWVKKQSGVVNNWTAELDVVYDWFKNPKVKKELFERVSNSVESMSIVGGEPTAVKEFFELLEYCDSKGTLKEKTITLITNLTNTNKNLTKWLRGVKGFNVYCSIDGLAERNEYIRYPSKWPKILESLSFYNDLVKHSDTGAMNFGPAVQLLNIDQLVDLVVFFEKLDEQYDSIETWVHWTGVVSAPVICDYRNAPNDYKSYVIDELEKKFPNVKNEKNKVAVKGHIQNLKQSLANKDNTFTLDSFVRYNDSQDKFRNSVSWRKLLPQLERSILSHTTGVETIS